MTSKTSTLRVTDEITLHPISLNDAMDIFRTIDAQRTYLGQWLPFVDATQRVEDSIAFIKSVIDAPPEQQERVFVIRYQTRFAGLIGFRSTDRTNYKTEIGYWLSEPFQKRGIVTASVQRLCEYAFDILGMNRITIRCAVENYPSQKIPERLGFAFEGIERAGELLSGDVFADLKVYSKLRGD